MRVVSRYEIVIAIHLCLSQIEKQLFDPENAAELDADLDEDLEKIHRLLSIFTAELKALELSEHYVFDDHWAIQALDEIEQRYDCFTEQLVNLSVNEPAFLRYGFAVTMNTCFMELEQRIAENQLDPNDLSREDLETLQRLLEEFEAELFALRFDDLEPPCPYVGPCE